LSYTESDANKYYEAETGDEFSEHRPALNVAYSIWIPGFQTPEFR
jgi:hypothetical protein